MANTCTSQFCAKSRSLMPCTVLACSWSSVSMSLIARAACLTTVGAEAMACSSVSWRANVTREGIFATCVGSLLGDVNPVLGIIWIKVFACLQSRHWCLRQRSVHRSLLFLSCLTALASSCNTTNCVLGVWLSVSQVSRKLEVIGYHSTMHVEPRCNRQPVKLHL